MDSYGIIMVLGLNYGLIMGLLWGNYGITIHLCVFYKVSHQCYLQWG